MTISSRRKPDSERKARQGWRIAGILAAGGMTVLAAAAGGESSFSDVPGLDVFHGNWCGAGNRLGVMGETLPPVDLLDAACMRHDLCIALRGTSDCGCDQIFLQELRHLLYPDPQQAIKARAIYDTMSWIPCIGPEAMTKPLWFFGQLLEDLHKGGPPPWDVLRRLFYTVDRLW